MQTQAHSTAGAQNGGLVRRLHGRLKLVLGLLAIYAPIVLVVVAQDRRGPVQKVFLLCAIWALEGILWAWQEGRSARRRARREGPAWRPELH